MGDPVLDAAVQRRLQKFNQNAILTSAPPPPRPAAPQVSTASYEPPPTELPPIDQVHLPTDQQPSDFDPNSGRQWEGHLVAGLLDATVGQLPTIAALPAAIYNSNTRDLDSYPEGVNTDDTWRGTYDRFSHNVVNNAEDERRTTDKIREGIYDFDTWMGRQAVNYDPLFSLNQRAVDAVSGTGDKGAYQDFQRDPMAEQGEVGYVSPAQEIVPEAIAAAIPSPLGKTGLVTRATSLIDDVPRMLATGARIADSILDNFVLPFAGKGVVSQTTNAGVSAAMTEGQRVLTGEDTLLDWPAIGAAVDELQKYNPNRTISPEEHLAAGMESSGISYGVVPGGI